MDIDLFSNYLIIAVFTLFSVLRIEHYRRARKAGYQTVVSESRKYSIFLSVLICYEVFTLFALIRIRSLDWAPQLLSWAAMDLPMGLRMFGAVLALLALALFVWIHRTLGHNLSAGLKIKENHTLVTRGPYATVRHPMYTAFFILHIAVFFLTANWFIGLTWMLGLVLIVLLRVRREEQMLLDRFGAEYLAYMDRTGRFLPPGRTSRTSTPKDRAA